jgi:Mn2+/Fe2+ NRAMP family transporter
MEHDTVASANIDIQADSRADSWFAKLGRGVIAGAADDDPSGIATYSQAGAQFGSTCCGPSC